jgi:restriction endonuclease S subunit
VTSNYDLKPLTQVCEVLSGGTPKTTVPEFWNGNIPWASVKDFNIDSRWFSKTEKSISQLGLDSCSSVLLEPGDLVISARGTVGVVGQCKMRTSFNQSNYGLRAKSALSKNDYLYYALSYAKRALIGDTHGGMFDTITRDTLDRLLIPVPTLKVQEQIAEILGSLDMKIAVNNALSKTLEDIAQTVFKSWFIDFDPVKAKMAGEKPAGMDAATAALFPDSMEESEIGLVPKGWEILQSTDLFSVLSGGTPKTSNEAYWKGDIPWFSVVDAPDSGGCFFIKTTKTITKEGLDNSAAKLVRPGVTVISARGTVGKTAIVAIPSTFNQSCYGIEGKYGDFFTYLLLQNQIARLQNISHGGMFDTITRDTFSAIKIAKPQTELMKNFESLVSPIFLEIRSLQFQSDNLASIRDSLLPRLILGELQIPEEMLAS